MSTDPIGYIVYRPKKSSIPSILADARPDNGGVIYVEGAAEDRLAELRRHGFDDYRMAAVVPVKDGEESGGTRCTSCNGDTSEYADGKLCAWCDPADTETHPDPLVEELRAADPKEFGRPAVPSVYAEYAALADAAPNRRVYNADAKAYFTERHEIPEELLKHLDHEIYLASGQYRLSRMVADEEDARGCSCGMADYGAPGHDGHRADRPATATCVRCLLAVEYYKGHWWTGDDFMCPDGEQRHEPRPAQ